MTRAEAVVDVGAVEANVARIAALVAPAAAMVVVKADGYGHGALAAAAAARRGGADWLGVALPGEARALRAAGDTGPLLAWLLAPGDALADLVAADVDLAASHPWALAAASEAARAAGRPARVHLKVDTGLGRNGAAPDDWPALVESAVADPRLRVAGVWSHLACADRPGSPVTAAQITALGDAWRTARALGVPGDALRHLASSGAVLGRAGCDLDLVRVGIAAYGLSPSPEVGAPAALGLRPAMTLRATVVHAKRVPAGWGVSYGHRYVTPRPTTLALLPLGYADGLPRAASGVGPVLVGGRRRTVAGTVAMDHVVVDVGDDPVAVGDPAVLFGPGDSGEPTADDWARACGTINYEVVTRVGARVPRRHVGG